MVIQKRYHQQDEDDALTEPDHVANSDDKTEKEELLDVLIIGAGWAGLSAASTLKKRGIDNVRILEAKDHIGGRAFTHHEEWEGKDVPLDLGAMWIQNAANNLLNDYANKYKIISHPSTFEPKVYRESNQGPLSEEEYERYSKVLYDRGFYATQEDRQDKAWRRGDEPLQKSADIFLKTLGNDPLKQKMTKLLLRDNISMEYSGSLNELSLKYWDSDSWIGGEKSDDFFVLSGYSSLVQAYAKDEGVMENIILNSPVTTINYEASGTVQVLYRDTSGDSNQPVMSICAKKVIITVPLGVLQAGSIMFVPELPQSTSNAIDRLGMGKMNKIFMFWKSDDVFWPSPSSEIEVLGDLTDRDSNFVFYNSLSFQEDKPALFAFFKGPMVHRLEEEYARSDPVLYEQRIVDLAMESLHSMFGTEIPRPEKVVVTQWNVDEYTMGAYSFNKVGMKQHDREVLASPIGEKRLFFSGEATHSKYFATTTGAFLTGRAAAKNAIKTLKKNEELK